MPISYADAFSLIWEKPAPIIYLDTCILLDIVRSPIRDNIDSNSAKLGKSLMARSNPNQRTLWLVTSATVEKEWQENIVGVLEETKREIIKLELRRRHFFAAVKSVTYVDYQDGRLERNDILHLLADFKSIAESLLNSCLVIVPEDEHLVRAMNRVKHYVPPASRGKEASKDCEVYELFLALCQDLQNSSAENKFVFLSSNTKDYGRGNSGGIQPELSKLGAKYATSIAWAEAIIDERT